jgi:glycosyltransferase involved in cell wall biosynthesis
MNIFAVTYAAPPMLVPATMRILKWFTGLTQLGITIDALVIEARKYRGPKDEALNRLVPRSGVTYHRIPTWDYSLLYELMKKCGDLFAPLLQPGGMGWYPAALRFLQSFNFKGIDLLFTCSAPHSSHLLGRRIKRRTGLPWVAFFSDPWVDNPLSSGHSRRVQEYNRRLEACVIEEADRLIFTSPETIDLVMEKYSSRHREKCRVLPHCYVPEWYQYSQATLPNGAPRRRIFHAGRFYSDRTSMPFLKAVKMVRDATEEDLHFVAYSCGNLRPIGRQYVQDNNLENIWHSLGTVPYLDSLAMMKSADYLLLIDAASKNGHASPFLPSKLIEYVGSGRPVLGMTPERGASARVLRERHDFVCDVEDVEAMAAKLEAINNGEVAARSDGAADQQYHYRNVAGMLESIFKELL